MSEEAVDDDRPKTSPQREWVSWAALVVAVLSLVTSVWSARNADRQADIAVDQARRAAEASRAEQRKSEERLIRLVSVSTDIDRIVVTNAASVPLRSVSVYLPRVGADDPAVSYAFEPTLAGCTISTWTEGPAGGDAIPSDVIVSVTDAEQRSWLVESLTGEIRPEPEDGLQSVPDDFQDWRLSTRALSNCAG